MKEKLGQEPAFPITEEQMDRIEQYPHMSEMAGMSKRFYAARAAMQGLLSNELYLKDAALATKGKNIVREIVSNAYAFADELLKQEFE